MATVGEVLALALGRHQAGDLAEAERLYRQVVQTDPSQADAFHLLGVLALQTGRHEQAVAFLRRAIALRPADPAFHCNLATASKALGRLDEAVAGYREALRLQPDFPDALCNLGNTLAEQDNHDEAAACYQEALRLRPGQAEVHCKLGNSLALREKWDQAAANYRRALELRPDHIQALLGLGLVLQEQGKLTRAIEYFQQVLRRNPALAVAHFRLARVFADLARFDEAEASYREVLRLEPGNADALNRLGGVLNSMGLVDEALACWRQALACQPDHGGAAANCLLNLHHCRGDDPRVLLEEHVRWARQRAERLESSSPSFPNDPDPERRLRVGFVVGHLGGLPAHFLEPVLVSRDRSRFYVVCYLAMKGPGTTDARLRDLADRCHHVADWSDERVAQQVREEGIDILVDLAGHAGGGRLLVFAHRPAPVQVTQFGYPGTTGLRAIGYRITDPFLDPPGTTEAFHTEELVRLPEIAWCYQPPEAGPAPNRLPALRAGRLTFASFNKLSKITAEVIALWSRLLRALPASRLLLTASGSRGDARIRQAFEEQGVGAQVELRPRRSPAEYLELYHEADMGLDPFPFTGGITTCDALWMGVPVLSLAGRTCVSRQGVSLLSNAGLPDWIARTPEEFVALARRWAEDLPGLSRLRAGLRHALRRSPLLDGRRYTRHLEQAYRELWRRWCQSRGPT